MKNADKRAFAELLGGLLELYGRKISPSAAELWWSAFEQHDLSEVRAAFSRYTQDPEQGRYPPTPASVLGCINSASVRLGADEAWALALGTFDEAATVCVTDEILEAVAAAAPVMETGDKIGTRMAFKAAYERITSQRRMAGAAPKWRLSMGWDAEQRAQVAQEALRLGRVTEEQVRDYLPAPAPSGPAAAVAGLLTGNVVQMPVGEDAKARANLRRLRDAISAGLSRDDHRDKAAERETFIDRKRAALDALAKLQGDNSAA